MTKKIMAIIIVLLIALGAGYFISKHGNKTAPSNQNSSTGTSKSGAGGISLDLSGQQLTTIPDSILSRTDITALNVSNNQLTNLPSSISKLTNLEVLNVENNRLVSFPPEISQLTKLREIHANNNRITSLPTELGNMTWLQSLDISGNNISSSEINKLKARLTNTQFKT